MATTKKDDDKLTTGTGGTSYNGYVTPVQPDANGTYNIPRIGTNGVYANGTTPFSNGQALINPPVKDGPQYDIVGQYANGSTDIRPKDGSLDEPQYIYGTKMVENYKPTNLTMAADQEGALAKLTALEEQGRPAYTGRYDEQIQQLLGDIYNRGPFSYNYNEDPLYAQYAESYTQGGRNAMKNTMGNAAALTGGYGNTYAQMAGQQAYNNYMQGLADKIPDLYQLAANRYDQETANLQSKLGTFNNQDSIDYSRFRDTMGDYDTDLAYAYQKWLAAQQQNNYLTELYQQYHKLDPNYAEEKHRYIVGVK